MPERAANNERVPFLTIPNMLSVTRLAVVLPEIYFACIGEKIPFLVLAAFALFTDSIDGAIARWLKQDTILGAKLDSLGDLATYISLPVCGWLLWPEVILAERAFVITAILSYLVPVTVGLIRFRRVTSYHTWAVKTAAVLMGPAVLIMFMDLSPWPFRIFTPIAALAGLEEIAITFILRDWQANIPTIWHAKRMRDEPASSVRQPAA